MRFCNPCIAVDATTAGKPDDRAASAHQSSILLQCMRRNIAPQALLRRAICRA
jgi:hypothetical protein